MRAVEQRRHALRSIGLALLCVACRKGPAEPPPPIAWHDLASGEALAARVHKPVVVFLFAEWSVADKMLDQETFASPEVRARMRDFVAIRIDVSDEDGPGVEEAKRRFRCVGVPLIAGFEQIPDGSTDWGYPPAPLPTELFRISMFVGPEKLVPVLRAAKASFDAQSRP